MEENKERKNKKVIPVMIVLVLVVLIFAGFNRYRYYERYVETDDAQVDGDLVAVIARVGGFIERLNFEDNQRVSKGQLLVQIDSSEYIINLNRAQSDKETTESKIYVSNSQIATSKLTAKELTSMIAETKAKLWQANEEYKRYTELVHSNAVTQQVFDKVKVDKEVAEASYEAALGKYNTSLSEIDNYKSQQHVIYNNIKQQEVGIDQAKIQLSYTKINAPVSGIVTRKKALSGQMVQSGQTLFSIVDENNIFVTANFKETQLKNIKAGQKVTIHIDAYPDQPIEGTIHNFASTTGAKTALLPPDNATGNFVKVVQRVPVKIKINRKSSIYKLLRPGMNVGVSVDTRS